MDEILRPAYSDAGTVVSQQSLAEKRSSLRSKALNVLHAVQAGAIVVGGKLNTLRLRLDNAMAGRKLVNPLPFLALAAVAGAAFIVTSVYTPSYVVTVDGVTLGVVSEPAVFEEVIDSVEARTAAILGGDEEKQAVFARLLSDAKLLEGAGCTAIAVPCNTSHYFLDEVQQNISIPIIHMIRETAKALASRGLRRPGILATDGTIQTGLYQKEFAAFGIEAAVPSPEAQKLVMSLIYDDIKSGRDGDPRKFAAVHKDLQAQGCDCGVLACTELSVFATAHHLPPFYTDAMAVLAERSVEACHRPLRDIIIK